MKTIKSKDNFLIVALCLVFTLIGVLLVQNEVALDNWYIEASADGLFGDSNRSLWVLCSNYIVTGLIWLLSLTGIRVFWLHFIIIGFTFISNILVCKMIFELLDNGKIIVSIIYLMIVTPFLFYVLNFTIAASYFITVGLLWVFHCIKVNKPKYCYIIGYMSFVIGFSLRWDCVLFGGCFLIPFFIKEFYEALKEKKAKKFILSYVRIYVYLCLFYILVTGSQLYILNMVEPGFNEWNTARSDIDDYEIPMYEDNEMLYSSLGISENDYNIIQSWNDYDRCFFDVSLYNSIAEIKENLKNMSYKGLVLEAIRNLFDNPVTWITMIIVLLGCLNGTWGSVRLICALMNVYIVLVMYFLIRGRFIYRIEYSIILSYAILFVYSVASDKSMLERIEKYSDAAKKWIIVGGCLFSIACVPFSGTGMYNVLGGLSSVGMYSKLMCSHDTLGYYMLSQMLNKELYVPVTINNSVAEEILSNKSNLYIELFCQNWKQTYPITDQNVLMTAKEGTASNLAFIGLYMPYLSPMQQVFSNYQIDGESPAKDICNKNVYIVVRKSENYDRSREVRDYIREHYYSDVQYSVVCDYGDTIVGKYMIPVDDSDYELENEEVSIDYSNEDEMEGFSEISLSDDSKEILDRYNIQYVQITSEKGTQSCFECMNDNSGRAIFYTDSLAKGEYIIELLCDDKTKIEVGKKLVIE